MQSYIYPIGEPLECYNMVMLALTVVFQISINVNVFSSEALAGLALTVVLLKYNFVPR